uniref:Uncharacterized protein n=1 Tax=Cacopsylla melanoneura TaxID=428564 RepID=A0A8D8LXV1_9HEMI
MTGESDKEERTDKRSSISKGLKHSSIKKDLIQDSRGKESDRSSNRERYPRRSNVHLEDIKSGSEGKEETKSTERKRYPRRSNVSHVSFAELDSDIEVLSDDSSASEEGSVNTLDYKNKKHSPTSKHSKLEPSTKNEYQNKPAESKDEKMYSKKNSDTDQQSCPKSAVQSNELDKGDNRVQKSAKGSCEGLKRWERVGNGNIWKVQPVNNVAKCETKELESKTLPGFTNSDKGKPPAKQVSMISPTNSDKGKPPAKQVPMISPTNSDKGKPPAKQVSMISPSTRSKDKPSSSQNTSDQQMSSRKPNIRTTRAK